MKKYIVEIEDSIKGKIEVIANNKNSAKRKAEKGDGEVKGPMLFSKSKIKVVSIKEVK